MIAKKAPLRTYRFTITVTILLTLLKVTSGLYAAGNNEHKLSTSKSPLVNRAAVSSFSAEANQDSDRTLLSFVTVGDPFNAPDDQGCGSVNRVYQISKYEVTASQYATFLNAVAWKEDPHGLYHSEMGSDKKVASIQRIVNEDGTYRYELIDQQRGDLPMTYVSLNDAERFCNWLENGSPDRDQEYELLQQSTESGAYTFLQDGDQIVVQANPNARYHIPSHDEWIKAAYYKGNGMNAGYAMYPTQKDTPPANGEGDVTNFANYQTYRSGLRSNFLDSDLKITTVNCFDQTTSFYQVHDMGGNVAEWTIPGDGSGLALATGGSWQSGYSWYGINDLMRTASPKSYNPSTATNFIGFRIAVSTPQIPSATGKKASNDNVTFYQDEAPIKMEKRLGSGSKLTPEDEALLTAIFITAATLSGSSLMFIIGEISWNYFIGGMTLEAIAATFTTGRIVSIVTHLVFNTYAMVKAEHDINAANKN